jgi:hypothetical protein
MKLRLRPKKIYGLILILKFWTNFRTKTTHEYTYLTIMNSIVGFIGTKISYIKGRT